MRLAIVRRPLRTQEDRPLRCADALPPVAAHKRPMQCRRLFLSFLSRWRKLDAAEGTPGTADRLTDKINSRIDREQNTKNLKRLFSVACDRSIVRKIFDRMNSQMHWPTRRYFRSAMS